MKRGGAPILFRRFNMEMVEEMVEMAENDATSRAAVVKRTSAMLTEIINEDRNHLTLTQRHGWQGTEEGKHTGDHRDRAGVNLNLVGSGVASNNEKFPFLYSGSSRRRVWLYV